ncbi:non-structural maintenance of chromosomes element 3 homolog [Linepithema humile]|uniref:non-structural maintenance of chromosomes element 3 homolog n=1 Tax=Linepithema humile TaxID=83485 RepID=UPI0006234995|nr:PREDICTED: melanoma-associated antigen G1-like [Linepithema humile]XP_012228636.1 PREDICTED: melanoma-associated antigen G1-like [Linepithema humile]
MSKRKGLRSTQNMGESSDIFLSQLGPSTRALSQESDRRTQRKNNSNMLLSQPSPSSDILLSQPGPSTQSSMLSQGSNRRTRASALSQRSDSSIRTRVLSQESDSSSQANRSSQRCSKNSDRESANLQNMMEHEQAPLISSIIRYILVADGNKQVIQKNHIVKNILNGNNKLFRSTIDEVKGQLFAVFGYILKEVENNKYILINDIENHLPHLSYNDNNKQVLLFLVLVHIFMHGESCKQEILWDYLRNLNIITENSFQHEYFGDVKQLVSVDFVNQRYLAKVVPEKNELSDFEYVWGNRAENEITYRSCLEFVANIYGSPLNKWRLQYKAMIEQEKKRSSDVSE